jgi:hypothetical protein
MGINSLQSALESSTTKGFLPHYDLTKFPVFAEILPYFIVEDEEGEDSFVNGVNTMESYKWVYNFIILNLYYFCIESLITFEVENDVYTDLKNKERELFSKLDPSIRLFLIKKGISVKDYVNIGFDTEFTKSGFERNRIVSSQLAISTKTYMLIPRCESYKLSRVDEVSNKLTFLPKSSSNFNYSKIETSIQNCVGKIRGLKYGKYDVSMLVLCESLKIVKGLNYFEQDDFTVFGFPRSSIQPYIKLSDSFSYLELTNVASTIASPVLQQTADRLKELLLEISSKCFTLESGREKLLESIYFAFSGYTGFEELSEVSDKVLPYYTEGMLKELCDQRLKKEKSLVRNYLNIPEKVSVTRKRIYTIIAHLTSADFSLLSDFDVLKEELSIVNGSFVTLGKPINLDERCVHVRDTMLLAPGLNKSLESIGRLYNTGFEKVKINQDDLENMHLFLDRSPEEFITYAVRDAVISLIHAC